MNCIIFVNYSRHSTVEPVGSKIFGPKPDLLSIFQTRTRTLPVFDLNLIVTPKMELFFFDYLYSSADTRYTFLRQS